MQTFLLLCCLARRVAEDETCTLKLERLVLPTPLAESPASGWSIEFDASIYGGGSVLKDADGTIREYFAVVWDESDPPRRSHVVLWSSAHQSFWEFCTLLLSLCTWGDRFTAETVSILGDKPSALQNALSFKGRGPLMDVARELSWRQARTGWKFQVGHLPSEFNVVADALSRTADPDKSAWPSEALAAALPAKPPRLCSLWRAAPV